MVRARSRARIRRSRRSGTTAPVDRVYYGGGPVRRGDEWGIATVARCAGGHLATTIAHIAHRRTTARPVRDSGVSQWKRHPHRFLPRDHDDDPWLRRYYPTPVIRPKGAAMSNLDLLAAPAVVRVVVAAGGYTIGSGRTVPTVAAVLGLISVVIAGLALARSAGRIGVGHRRAGAVVALVLGLVSTVIGAMHAAYSAGGFGTGNGLAGALAALVLGLIGMATGGLALARCCRTA
jgi:hypothetical protein